MDKLNKIERSILETIIYFDIFDFPLTKIELYKNLYLLEETISFKDFINTLKQSNILNLFISNKEDFYFLKDRENIVKKRKEKYIISYKKYAKAKRFIKILSYFYCFKFIGVCNTLAIDNTKEDSDIDLFIISKKNRVWTSRFISVLIAKVLNLRPKEKNKKNKICLSFYIDEENMNIEGLSKNDNIYFIYWLSQIVPIYDRDNCFNKFFNENNWINKYLKNIFEFNSGDRRKIEDTKIKKIIKKLLNYFSSNFLENILMKIQIKTFNKDIKEKLNLNDDVFCNNHIIKLHTKDRREEYKNKFQEKLKKYEKNF